MRPSSPSVGVGHLRASRRPSWWLDALLREAIPGGAPHGIVPIKLERWRHNAVYCTPAGARISCSAGLVILGPRGAREKAQRWDVSRFDILPLALGSISKMSNLAILGKRVTEKRATVTRKAVETTGGDVACRGGHDSGRRREASWSGGAAERGRRPVTRRTSLGSSAPGPVTSATPACRRIAVLFQRRLASATLAPENSGGVRGRYSDSVRDSDQRRGPARSRKPVTATGHRARTRPILSTISGCSGSGSGCGSTTRVNPVLARRQPWWRGLPARAKTTRLHSSDPTTGRMPVAPWAAAASAAAAAASATGTTTAADFLA
jgi:hypothetical protein